MAPRTLRYLLAALAVGVLYLAFGTPADAQSPFWRRRPVPPPYSFSVEDENGNTLPTFRQDGRSLLLGEPGQRYNIRLRNPTAQRIEAVVSVDGRDAISGDPGDYVSSRGYVVPAYGSLLVEGFRRNYEEVAAFRFTSPERSYSARLGTPENVGVIGVAFFPERAEPPPAPIARRALPRPPPPYYHPRPAPLPYDSYGRGSGGGAQDKGAPGAPAKRTQQAPSAAPPPASEGRGDSSSRDRRAANGYGTDDLGPSGSVNNLGTEFGETRDSVVSTTAFVRASQGHPALVSTLRYDDADGLSARGIDLSALGYYAHRAPNDEPQAFPVSHFAQPPP